MPRSAFQLAFLLAVFVPRLVVAEPPQISDAWLGATPPGVTTGAGYMVIRNGSSAVALVAASGDIAREVQLHHHTMVNGMMRMERVSKVSLDPGQTVRFEPGGLHLMLFGVEQLGESLEIVLETADGQRFPVRFEAVPIGAGH